MGRFATGVALLAVQTDDVVHAITVNSVTSVSLEPAVLSVCLRQESRMLRVIVQANRFGLSVLASVHEPLSRRYSGHRVPTASARWRLCDGTPVVEDALAGFACTLLSTLRVGDHTVIFGQVRHVYESSVAGEALVYFEGAYRRLPAPPTATERQLPEGQRDSSLHSAGLGLANHANDTFRVGY